MTTDRRKYEALVEASLAAAREARAQPIGRVDLAKVDLAKVAQLVIVLRQVEAAQLLALARHLGREPADVAAEAVRSLLVTTEAP
ncbi:MAG: hypothetical protein ACLP1X_18655 [Polyangiaceae bacterium]